MNKTLMGLPVVHEGRREGKTSRWRLSRWDPAKQGALAHWLSELDRTDRLFQLQVQTWLAVGSKVKRLRILQHGPLSWEVSPHHGALVA